MEIKVSAEQGRVPVTVLHVKGDLDMATSDQVLAQARRAFDAGARNIVLDLGEVPFMSSTGLRTLHAIFEMLRGSSPGESDEAMRRGLADGTFKSPHFKLVNPSKRVYEVLSMAGFDMFLETHRSVRDAVASF